LTTDRETFLVGQAGLFDVDIDIADGLGDTDGFVLNPAGISVGDQSIPGLQAGGDGANSGDVGIGIATDLELEPSVTFGAVAGDFSGHFLRGFLGDGAVEVEVIAVAATEQFAYGEACGFAEDIPTGDVDSTFDVGMALESGVHGAVEASELTWVVADEVGSEFAQAGADPFGVGGEIERAERADFAVADVPRVGLDPYDGAIEHGDGLTA